MPKCFTLNGSSGFDSRARFRAITSPALSISPRSVSGFTPMSTFTFLTSALFARQFAPSTFEQANAVAIIRVLRWMAVAAAVMLALSIALAWVTFQGGLTVYNWTERFDSFAAVEASEPSIETLAAWSDAVVIEWPAVEPVTDWSELTVAQLRREAAAQHLSIRQGGRVLRKSELIAAMG